MCSVEPVSRPTRLAVQRRKGPLTGRIASLSPGDMRRGAAAWSAGADVLGPLLAVVYAALLWGAALRGIDLSRMDDWGLLAVLPPSAYAALLLLTISFCLVVHRRPARTPIVLPHVVALIAMIHGTPAILYGTLRYSWAWKHVGMVDYIQRRGSIDPAAVSELSAYHNWPGFFALSTLLTEAAGFTSALSFASWAPVFFNLLYLGALLLIFSTWTTDRRLIWLGVWFFYLTNWVGQDYFSPQALNYFFHLAILGICLRWFGVATPPAKSAIERWLVFDRAASLFRGLVSRPAPGDRPSTAPQPLQRAGLLAIVILLFSAVVSSHQLTPFMTIGAITALVIFRRCSARSLPLLMTILTIAWIISMAVPFVRSNIQSVILSIGQLQSNAGSNLIDLSQASPGQQFVAVAGRGLTAALWGTAVLGAIRRRRHGYWDLPCLLLAIAPFPMLVGNSYGGEILFRVYLFTVPFMAFFAAALVYPSPAAGTSWRAAAMTVVLSGTLLVGFCFAYYGKERMNYFTKNEVYAAQYLYTIAPAGSLLIEGSTSYPARLQNYERYSYFPLARQLETTQAEVLADPANVLAEWMADRRYSAAYLIVTRSQKAHVDMTGVMPAGSLARIEQALLQSGRFEVVFANPDATIFTLTAAP